MFRTLNRHWPEYLMEAAGLFGTLLEYPQSPAHLAIVSPFVRCLLFR